MPLISHPKRHDCMKHNGRYIKTTGKLGQEILRERRYNKGKPCLPYCRSKHKDEQGRPRPHLKSYTIRVKKKKAKKPSQQKSKKTSNQKSKKTVAPKPKTSKPKPKASKRKPLKSKKTKSKRKNKYRHHGVVVSELPKKRKNKTPLDKQRRKNYGKLEMDEESFE